MMSPSVAEWPDAIDGHFAMPGVVGDVVARRGRHASIYSWTGDGSGRTPAALRALKRYGSHVVIHDPGEPGDASRNYWDRMVAEGLVDEMHDALDKPIPLPQTTATTHDSIMPTRSYVPDQLRVDILKDAMDKLTADTKKLPDGYHSATVEPDVAMLVEPLNDAAYVFVLPDTVHLFEHAAGSGSDALRQRMRASIFFRQVVERSHTMESKAAPPARHRVASA